MHTTHKTYTQYIQKTLHTHTNTTHHTPDLFAGRIGPDALSVVPQPDDWWSTHLAGPLALA